MKTLVIGLDAATWSVIDRLLEDDKLPNLSGLIESGSSGVLRSSNPPMTPLAWTSIATGVNPGDHGIYDFLEINDGTYNIEPTDYNSKNLTPVWDILNTYDLNVGVINYPMVRPPDHVEPFFISGIPAPDNQNLAYPEEVQKIIDDNGYKLYPDVNPHDGLKRYYHELDRVTESQGRLTRELMQRYELDVLLSVFMTLDWAQHYLWDFQIEGQNAVDLLYMKLDDIIGQFLDDIPENCNIIVLSDHGAKRIKGKIHLNNVFEDMEYLTRRSTSSSSAIDALQSMWELLVKSVDNLPPRVRHLSKKVIPDQVISSIWGEHEQQKLGSRIEWSDTEVFSFGYMGRIYINKLEAFPDGTVAQENVENVIDEIQERLLSLEHPKTNQPLIDDVVRKESLYSGDNMCTAADLIIQPKDWEYSFYGDFGSEWFEDPHLRVADHDPEGVLIMSGERLEQGNVQGTVNDITPTLLHLHDIPLLEGFDGHVLPGILDPGESPKIIEQYEIDDERMPNKNFEDDSSVKQRLKDLGYM
ncbi:alkaline phosphatase family protein [Halorarius litoreus]|uniref:alkaline phosphatase family protein n=1 Tax=Halorarius litoreus TaxID=2962676 RepID=UPI0020CFE341|nr:alkaline phosphatase family protein [Halorarius litoreus]